MNERRTNNEHVGLQKFARNLYDARVEKGWSQSELAREVWGSTTDKRGYSVARNRDRISQYEMGNTQPTGMNLIKIAKALGKDPADLAPGFVAARVDREHPALAMHMVEGKPNQVHLQVNMLTSLALASKVIAMLSEKSETDGA